MIPDMQIARFIDLTHDGLFREPAVIARQGAHTWIVNGWLHLEHEGGDWWSVMVWLPPSHTMRRYRCLAALHGSVFQHLSFREAVSMLMEKEAHRRTHVAMDQVAKKLVVPFEDEDGGTPAARAFDCPSAN